RAGPRLAGRLLPAPDGVPREDLPREGALPDLHLPLGVVELPRRDLALPRPVRALGRVRGCRDPDRARHRVSARLLDRLPRRALEEPLPPARDRAVLRHLPDPDARLGDDPLRRRGRHRDAAAPRDPGLGRPPARDVGGRDRGDHLQLPALHGPAALRQPRADRLEADRGGAGPLREQGAGLSARDASALAPGRLRRDAPDVHPGCGRLHQRAAPRHAEAVHDRQRHPVAVPGCAGLPLGGRALVRADGCDPRRGARVRPLARDRAHDRDGGGAMSTASAAMAVRPRGRVGARALTVVRRNLLNVYALLALGYLFLPIAVVIAFSFNNPAGRFNFTWQGFTFRNWTNPFGYPGLRESVVLSIQIALLSSFVATVLGTMIALALVRYGFRGRGLVNLLIFVPMATPEIVMGASLLALFVSWRYAQGFMTILIAHIMFNISYVVVTVKARLVGFDRHLEEAAMDLG